MLFIQSFVSTGRTGIGLVWVQIGMAQNLASVLACCAFLFASTSSWCTSANSAAGPFLVCFFGMCWAEDFSRTLRGCWHSCELASMWTEGWCTRKEREEELVFYDTLGVPDVLSITPLWVWDGELRKAKTLNLVKESRVRSIAYWEVLQNEI